MKQHQIDAIKEQIDIHKKRLDDPELSEHERSGILKLIDDHEKQVAKGAEKELTRSEIIQEQISLHRKRLEDLDTTAMQKEGIKKLISDLRATL